MTFYCSREVPRGLINTVINRPSYLFSVLNNFLILSAVNVAGKYTSNMMTPLWKLGVALVVAGKR